MVAPLIVGAARVAGKTAIEHGEKKLAQSSAVRSGRYKGSIRGRSAQTQAYNAQKKITQIFKNVFNEKGIGMSDTVDTDAILKNPPVTPEFPYVMFGLAVLKDLLDIPLEISIIGIILTTVFSFLIAVILFFWCRGKISGGWWKKKLIRWIWGRYILVVISEFIPFIKMVPVTTIFILMVHYQEVKIVRLALRALDELKRLGLLKYAGV